MSEDVQAPRTAKHDWRGEEVPADQSPDTEILVWMFEPGSNGFDVVVIRDYFDAMEWATDKFEMLMDGAGEADLLEHGVALKAKLVRMTLREYGDIQENEA